jgi:ribonuclease P protein component
MLGAGPRTGRFRRSDRLLDSRDFRRVLRQGRRRAGRDLVVVVAPKSDPSNKRCKNAELRTIPGSRLGITVSRKVGNAVCRNRFKRRVRAWFREHRDEFDRDVDLVVIARKSGGQLGFAELDERLSELLGLNNSAR